MAKRVSKNHVLIHKFYLKALNHINKNQRQKAEDLLYVSMPKYLYDMSLDILFNRNEKNSNHPLRELIVEVDSVLNNVKEKDVLELQDEFNGTY